jgi:flagellar hook-associated protein 1 FlgK
MSISGALSNALSGLSAASRGAEVVSSNLANSMTDGYGRRELDLSARSVGGRGAGVQVNGVVRVVDAVLLANRRLADADVGRDGAVTTFLRSVESAIGLPEAPGSLASRLATLESSLGSAASRPDSEARLQAVMGAMTSLVDHVRDISGQIQTSRMEADQSIAKQVDEVNNALSKIAELNKVIRGTTGLGQDMTALYDQRQQLIDKVAQVIPLREVPRDFGEVALYSDGGAILLDGSARKLEFQPVGIITPDMTLASGALSGLSLNGRPIRAEANGGQLGGGSLGAQFSIRDNLAPEAQSRLDAFARDLMERFEAPAADPTLTPGAAGLFTDQGSPLDPLDEVGLAGRLQVNALADPSQGGDLWRLRAGLEAAGPGDAGQAAGLHALGDALTTLRTPSSGSFLPGDKSSSGLAADMLSIVGSALQSADLDLSASNARRDSLKTAELAGGVDSDQELQRLLLIEKAYAANARVVQTIDSMLDILMRL